MPQAENTLITITVKIKLHGIFFIGHKESKRFIGHRTIRPYREKIIPKNADPTRTHLNRVLVEYPDGVHGRDEAIAHRLNTAGIRRKITHDQVRVFG
ncbi:mobilization protein [human gut metagenome]|uniref:Mobilization protein n=1 Tax=human gut metagenome TaxID=408170 RepID=K1U0V0_9ZZZZ